ncbi:MAG: 50S ribosomal protein L25, partial [Candidatus Hydrothermae bacterium]|nr:50S ribosomal protein L25 [Candidatus Hydrothermae bacterium]
MNFELKLEKRTEKGKSANRKLRREGYLPAIMYGHGEKPQMVKVKRVDFDRLFKATKG